jgi:hypothetical protein
MRPTTRWSLLVVALLAVIACGSPSAAGPSDPPPTISPSVPSSPGPSSPPASTPSPTSEPTAAPTATPIPSGRPSSTPTLSDAERFLLSQLRSDARIGCVPRRADLPPGSDAGVECRPPTALVARVGIYGFRPDVAGRAAIDAYRARLRSVGISLGSGDCAHGTPGDASWPAYLPDGDGDGPSELRSGCYRDADGIANVRVTCYGDIYIGVLGTGADVAALYAWTWKVAPGESVHRDPPGICAAPD